MKYLGIFIVVIVIIAGAFFVFQPKLSTQPLPSVSVASPAPSSSRRPVPTPTPVATPPIQKGVVLIPGVPFAAQAPYGTWDDPRQQDGCEEASALIAVSWARGVTAITKDDALKDILAIADFEQATYGSYHDTSASDTIKRIFIGYYKFENAILETNINTDDIIEALRRGMLVVVPLDGQKLGNPYFTAPGPDRHMLVIMGYDPRSNEFITQDPGTRHGENYRYKAPVMQRALRDYPTGDHLPITAMPTAMIVISR